jgi:hypothetical protein
MRIFIYGIDDFSRRRVWLTSIFRGRDGGRASAFERMLGYFAAMRAADRNGTF